MKTITTLVLLAMFCGALAASLLLAPEDVVCPDQKSHCPTGFTCCEGAHSGYGCCPYPDALCCEDKQHCCPQGYTCDVGHSKCQKPSPFDDSVDEIQMKKSIRSIPGLPASMKQHLRDVVCRDGQSRCSDGTTCCLNNSGSYACCPYPNASCCDDGVHCCPSGFSCSGSQCARGESLLTILANN